MPKLTKKEFLKQLNKKNYLANQEAIKRKQERLKSKNIKPQE
jgi:hypothetical protein